AGPAWRTRNSSAYMSPIGWGSTNSAPSIPQVIFGTPSGRARSRGVTRRSKRPSLLSNSSTRLAPAPNEAGSSSQQTSFDSGGSSWSLVGRLARGRPQGVEPPSARSEEAGGSSRQAKPASPASPSANKASARTLRPLHRWAEGSAAGIPLDLIRLQSG